MKKIAAFLLAFALIAPISLRPAFADDETMARLKVIEEKQDRLLQEMAELKAEMQIVKVRVSSR